MYNVILKQNEEKRIKSFYPWIYANEVSKITGKDKQGSICKVLTLNGEIVGYGYINHASKIIVRMLLVTKEELDENYFNYDYFKNLVHIANTTRISQGYNNSYRAIFSESDNLPGLIVDKYDNYLSCQFLTLGMEVRKDMIIDILKKEFNPLGIYERSDVAVREKEGLKEQKGILFGEIPDHIIIEENGLKINVDIINGQKTGYFLDQQANRDMLKFYVKDKTVLDCFCNVGGFSLCAAKYGASDIYSLDISERATLEVTKNAKLNNFKNIHPICIDVFKALRDYKEEGKKFDVVILDPPAFTKSIDTVKEGYKGYLDINTLGLKLVNKGGYLITCSCSQHLTMPLFLKMINETINHANIKAKLVDLRFQGKDHASLLNMDEALYLKVAVIQII